MTESEWTRKICKELELTGALIFAIVGAKMQASGWPDRLVICKGWCGLIEFKAAKKWLTSLQEVIVGRIIRRGRYVYIARMPGELFWGNEKVGEFCNGVELLQLILEHSQIKCL
jgi:hypothetical protein